MALSNKLFSSYKQGENRVTGTILAVFERLNFHIVESILKKCTDFEDEQLLNFTNQAKTTNSNSVPDGLISANFNFYLETKTSEGSLNPTQLQQHLKLVKKGKKLIYLTPHHTQPSSLKNKKIYWLNFQHLKEYIESTIQEEEKIITEREKYLLYELLDFFNAENLLTEGAEKRVLIIPASNAIKEYDKKEVYICQKNRTFQPSHNIAFYYKNQIEKIIPKVYAYIDEVNLAYEKYENYQKDIFYFDETKKNYVKQKLAELSKTWNKEHVRKILILSKKDSEDTIKLSEPIVNDSKNVDGTRTVAFTQNQRYSTIDKIKIATKTSELLW